MRNLFTIFLSSLIIACGDKTEDTSGDVDTAADASDPADEENEGGEDTGSAESEE